ncbi:chemotaxis protein CheA [Hathewaya massiliensis]|uniref:chemotaxis protein CheA n=1 Tax=Hathewaya massiliensis TaxID=1964382 RepID=UPI00115B5EDE|nr:chemotaxis protein CheA [Hathewaya massiliensis]
MDTSQYLSMFLEESMDNLQVLNESLLELEQNPEDGNKLNEIFRVAHTIKGMAATMGFSEMAELTHKMEDVLSKFREGQLKVTAEVVTVLFKCLDTLELMVDNIAEGIEETIDVSDLINKLEGIADGNFKDNNSTTKVEEVVEEKQEELKAIHVEEIDLNEYDINVIKQAKDKNFNAYAIKINLSESTILKSARAFLIFKSLEDCGEIIKSIPTTDDIESENFEFEIKLVLLTLKDDEEVSAILNGISEVDRVEVNPILLQNKVEHGKVKEEIQEKPIESKEKKEVLKENKTSSKKSGETEVQHKKAHQSVRVDLERLDKFLTMVSELVIHRTRLEQLASTHKLNDLNETLEQIGRTTSDLQDLVMKIRMLPLEVVFNRFPRMIRDLSVELGKEMELIIQGQETELDRTVIDEIGEPLIHLLRNAADHGVEDRDTRIANGKEPVGKIRLSAYPEGTKAIIKVEDDGGGIDVDRVREKAEEKGINTEGMSESDIKNLIFHQGFSTNKQVTDISGRGVGMDVVKTKITALGGTVDVVSEIGKGTSFIIRLPLTLQIIQALLVKVGNETMAISLGYIDRVINFKEDLIKRTRNKEVIIYNNNVIPLVRVNKKLDLADIEGEKKYIVIVNVGEKTVGLLVDDLLGQQEIVIKPFGKTLQGLNEYIGATILGDGLVTLILDVGALI